MWIRVFRTVVALTTMFGCGLAINADHCDVQESKTQPDRVDVHCTCMQRLSQMDLHIDRLSISQTACPNKGLLLSWPELETLVAPRSLTLSGAHVFFDQPQNTTWTSSITELNFNNCTFQSLPDFAFVGLMNLTHVRIVKSKIDVVQTGAFSSLKQLSLIEIANSNISTMQRESIANLPSLEDLAFVHCSIGEMNSGAIVLPKMLNPSVRCSAEERTLMDNKEFVDDLLGRKLESTNDLPLPDYGTRFLLFKNRVKALKSSAIVTESLSFLIAGGNVFESIESDAFTMELYNQCEISAAMFVGNTFQHIDDWAFRGLRGQDGANYQAFIALANNTFYEVAPDGFTLAKSLVIFTVEENKFQCECDGFGWILSNANSDKQRELEKELVVKASCLDGMHVINFASTCSDDGLGSVTTPTVDATTVETEGSDHSNTEAIPSTSSHTAATLATITLLALSLLLS